MRKTLLSLTALAALLGAGVVSSASAAPADAPVGATVQTVQFDGGGDPAFVDWREREWRHREWERHRRWEEMRRWHEWHEHRGW